MSPTTDFFDKYLGYESQNILIAPLNWGLGHATRCIPIIRYLLSRNNDIFIASDGGALELLMKEFPMLKCFELPSYNIQYPHSSMLLNMAKNAQDIMRAVREESKIADALSRKFQIDVIISDNRLGFYTDGVENVYLTHQIQIPGPRLISAVASKMHKQFIHNFDRCIVPDNKGSLALAGKLSKGKLRIPLQYIGPLTRFLVEDLPIVYDYTAILSGPEPQRTHLEAEIIQLFNAHPSLSFCLVRGTDTYRSIHRAEKHIKTYKLLETETLNKIINQSKTIICRSGYTSIMDLAALGKSSIILPTPGQYEQIYLAEYISGRFGFLSKKSVQEITLSA